MPLSEEQRTFSAVDVAVAARADTHELQRHGEQRKDKDKELLTMVGAPFYA